MMHWGSQPATYNKQQSCSAVQCSPSIVRTCSANPVLSRENANPAPLFRFLFLFFIFLLLAFLHFSFSLLTSRTSVCDLLLRSICTCTLCFCFGGGRVKLGTGGMHGPMGAWHNSSRGKREGKSRRAVFSVFFHLHIFFDFSSQVYICLWEVFSFFLRSF